MEDSEIGTAECFNCGDAITNEGNGWYHDNGDYCNHPGGFTHTTELVLDQNGWRDPTTDDGQCEDTDDHGDLISVPIERECEATPRTCTLIDPELHPYGIHRNCETHQQKEGK